MREQLHPLGCVRVLLDKTINGHAIVCYVSHIHAYHRTMLNSKHNMTSAARWWHGHTGTLTLLHMQRIHNWSLTRRHFSRRWMIDSCEEQINWFHSVTELCPFLQHCQHQRDDDRNQRQLQSLNFVCARESACWKLASKWMPLRIT